MNESPAQLTTSTLTFMQQTVVEMLADGMTTVAIAKECKIHRSTIHNWRRYHPAFIAALEDAQTVAAEDWHARTQQLGLDALVTLRDIIRHDDHPSGVRLKAVLHVLETVTMRPEDRNHKQQMRARNNYAKTTATVELPVEPCPVAIAEPAASLTTNTATSTDFDTFSETQQPSIAAPVSEPTADSTHFDTFSSPSPTSSRAAESKQRPRPRLAKTQNGAADRSTAPSLSQGAAPRTNDYCPTVTVAAALQAAADPSVGCPQT